MKTLTYGPWHLRKIAVTAAWLCLWAGVARAQSAADSFNPGANDNVRTVAVQADGKILVGGLFTLLGGGTGTTSRSHIGRLNADGSVDATFNPGTNGFVYAIAIQADGKILVAGDFTMIGGGGAGNTARSKIGRLNADGSVDAAFNPGANDSVDRLALQPDGKILASGTFTMLGGGGTGTVARKFIGRLNADGSLDTGFDPGANGFVVALAVQADGKIVVGGQFSTLGGGTGTTARNHIGRLNADGSIDTGFNPGCNNEILVLKIQSDGKILAGGEFTKCGGGTGTSARAHVVRINPDGSLDALFNPSMNSTVWTLAVQADGRILVGGSFTGIRNGLLRLDASGAVDMSFNPGADNLVYSLGIQSDGMAVVGGDFTMLGGGGLGTTPRRNIGRVLTNAVAATGLIQNGTFSNGTTGWQLYEQPDIVASVVSGVLHYFKADPTTTESGQAVVYQETGQPMAAGAPLLAQFDLGNSSTVRKRVSVLLIDSNFSDLSVCTFWLAPSAPLRTYFMRTHTAKAWVNAAIYFYAATPGSQNGDYLLDNVLLEQTPGLASDRTDCVDPAAPVAAAGAASANLLVNGDFSTGVLSPWLVYGDLTQRISGGGFEFFRPGTAGQPAGVVFQPTGQAMVANQILTASFQLANSSAVRKRVTVLLHDLDFSDLAACTFWLPAGQTLSTYTMRGFATQAWGNATLSVYAATVGTEQWIRLDNVTLQRTPGATIGGTECIEAATGPVAFEESARAESSAAFATMPARSQGRQVSHGFARTSEASHTGTAAGWRAEAGTSGRATLLWAQPVDLTTATSAILSFQSSLASRGSTGEVHVSRDGETWETVATVPATEGWTRIDVDLAAWLGQIVYVRFVFDGVAPGLGAAPDEWRIDEVSVEIQCVPPRSVEALQRSNLQGEVPRRSSSATPVVGGTVRPAAVDGAPRNECAAAEVRPLDEG